MPLNLGALEAMIAGRFVEAGRILGALNPEWPEPLDFLAIFRDRLVAHPGSEAWLARAIVLRGPTPEVVGHIGFHLPPGDERTVEIGYTVFESYRGTGIATEAAGALCAWAFGEGIQRVVASIAPSNGPSLAVAARLGFERAGEHVDDVDGLEYILELQSESKFDRSS